MSDSYEYYNKLVRDNIPDIIRQRGRVPVTREVSVREYFQRLVQKLREEADEFQEHQSLEEFIDIVEVLKCIADEQGWTAQEIEEAREEKVRERGSFTKRIVLVSVGPVS